MDYDGQEWRASVMKVALLHVEGWHLATPTSQGHRDFPSPVPLPVSQLMSHGSSTLAGIILF